MAPIRKLSATIFIRRSATRRWASASGSAPAKDSAKDARARGASVAGPIKSGPAAGGPDASPLSGGSVYHHTIMYCREPVSVTDTWLRTPHVRGPCAKTGRHKP